MAFSPLYFRSLKRCTMIVLQSAWMVVFLGNIGQAAQPASGSGAIVTTPNVCKDPPATGPVPVPYPNVGQSTGVTNTNTKVKISTVQPTCSSGDGEGDANGNNGDGDSDNDAED